MPRLQPRTFEPARQCGMADIEPFGYFPDGDAEPRDAAVSFEDRFYVEETRPADFCAALFAGCKAEHGVLASDQ